MKKQIVLIALAIASTLGARPSHAADNGAANARFLLGAGLTGGGDTLVTSTYTDGSSDSVKAGGLVHLYAGAEFRLGERAALQTTVGYHADSSTASNGSVRFTRVPIDVLALFNANDRIRLGVGAQFVTGATLRGRGVASNISADFDSTVGAIVEGEYLITPHTGLKLRYVAEKLQPSYGGDKVDASHVGLLFSYYF